jgi:hypothetical protein
VLVQRAIVRIVLALALTTLCCCGETDDVSRARNVGRGPASPPSNAHCGLFEGMVRFQRIDGLGLRIAKVPTDLAMARMDPYLVEITSDDGGVVLSWIAHPQCSMVTRNGVVYRTEYDVHGHLGDGNGVVVAFDLGLRRELWRTTFPEDPVSAEVSHSLGWKSSARLSLSEDEMHLDLVLSELRVRSFTVALKTGALTEKPGVDRGG